MTRFDASSVNLYHLRPHRVSYEPKNIHTEAIQVTEENICRLALEFDAELLYSEGNGKPYFMFKAARWGDRDTDETGMTGFATLYPKITDWIVPLRNQIHVIRHTDFVNTFEFDDQYNGGTHSFDESALKTAREVADERSLLPVVDF